MFSTTTIVVMVIVAAHFIIGIGLLVYKIKKAGKEADLKENDTDSNESKTNN